MKLGVGYIVFSGSEFLKPSLQNIRPFADYICVVVGQKSHSGHPLPPWLTDLVVSLKKEKLIDELVYHDGESTEAAAIMQGKCREKRELARQHCQNAGCSHYLIRDCDEFHNPKQFEAVLKSSWLDKYDVLISRLYEYWGDPVTRAKEVSRLYVPFIQKIRFPLKGNSRYALRVDRGRTAVGWTTKKVLTVDELVLHHFTAVRYDMREMLRKWQGHGHLNRCFDNGQQYIDSVNKLVEENETVTVDDIFGIQKYWEAEWKNFINGYVYNDSLRGKGISST